MIKSDFKLFIATAIGNVFEMFDFFVFVFLSPIIASLFFPSHIPGLSLIFTYLTITISYLVRPIGGIVLGNLGDKYGRKSVFTISILCTAIPCLVIGFLPTYQQIGYLATSILVISRVFQGFSSGAELPGAITFIAEKYSHKNYYYYCAWIPFGANLSIALGSLLVKLMISSISQNSLYTYGWRIPFLLGGLLAFIGFYIRRQIGDTSQFEMLKSKKQLQKVPVASLFYKHKTSLVLSTLIALVVSIITSIFHLFLPTLFTRYLHLSIENSVGISAAGAFTLAVFILLVASLTNKYNPIKIMRLSLVGLIIVFSLILGNWLKLNTVLNLYLAVIVISILIAGVNGVYSGIFVELFPTEVRYSGVAVSFTLATTLGAGLAPLWTSLIMKTFNSYSCIVLVCLIITIVCLISSYFLKHCINYVVK